MKKIILASLLVASVATTAFAGQQGPGQQGPSAAQKALAAKQLQSRSAVANLSGIDISGPSTGTNCAPSGAPVSAGAAPGTSQCYYDLWCTPSTSGVWSCEDYYTGVASTISSIYFQGERTIGKHTVDYSNNCTNDDGTFTCTKSSTRSKASS